MLGWLTPEEIPTGTACRVLILPDDQIIVANVLGALLELTKPENYEQFGSITPAQIAAAMADMWDNFVVSECVTVNPRPALIRDVKATNTPGGTFNSGAWQTRTLNDLIDIDGLGVTLDTNEFTLPSGKWFIRWRCPAFLVDEHQSRLWRVTDTAAVGYGMVIGSGTSHAMSVSEGSIIQDVPVTATYRIEHRSELTRATDGFGLSANFGTDLIYSQVECWRMGDYA